MLEKRQVFTIDVSCEMEKLLCASLSSGHIPFLDLLELSHIQNHYFA